MNLNQEMSDKGGEEGRGIPVAWSVFTKPRRPRAADDGTICFTLNTGSGHVSANSATVTLAQRGLEKRICCS